MICGVSHGRFSSLQEAVDTCVQMQAQYIPNPTDRLERKYRRFNALYQAALKISAIV